METALMAGKSWQPSHEHPCREEKTGTHHTDKTVEREEGEGVGKQPPRRVINDVAR